MTLLRTPSRIFVPFQIFLAVKRWSLHIGFAFFPGTARGRCLGDGSRRLFREPVLDTCSIWETYEMPWPWMLILSSWLMLLSCDC